MQARLLRTQVIVRGSGAIFALGLLAALTATVVFCRTTPLPAVDAPLAPAAAGSWFTSDGVMSAPTPRPKALNGTELPVPPHSTGTHITASLSQHDGSQLVAVWGDPQLWEKRGEMWQPAPGIPPLTATSAEIVGLSEEGLEGQSETVVATTRRAGRFALRDGKWQSIARANAPYDANAQALTSYRGSLFVATLNDGLVTRDGKGVWGHIAPPTISTNAPRHFVVWHNDLYVRYGDGTVDRFDGRVWTRDVFSRLLPRHQVAAMATDGQTLFLAQWAGWSETRDGTTFANHFPADLRNQPIIVLLPTTNRLYVGTQGRGIAVFDRDTDAVRCWQDERQGIGDDWITALAVSASGQVVAGTFVSGAFRSPAEATATPQWQSLETTQNDCVTATIVAPGATFVALRRGGVRRYGNDGAVSDISDIKEAQCLFADTPNHLLLVGTRTGILALSQDDNARK